MSDEEKRAKSGVKLKQITDLMALLHVRVEAKQRIDDNGIIENIVFWSDHEQYPSAPTLPDGVNAEVAPDSGKPVEPTHA